MDSTERDTDSNNQQTYHPLLFATWAIIITLLITIWIRACIQFHQKQQITFFKKQTIIKIVNTTLKQHPWKSITIKRHDNLKSVFIRAHASLNDYHQIIQLKKAKKVFRKLKPKQIIYFLINTKNKKLEKLVHKINKLKYLEIIRIKDHFETKIINQPLDKKLETACVIIHRSLNQAASTAGFPSKFIWKLSNIFSWQINFSKAIRSGDQLKVVYEQYYACGKKAKTGKILAAEFINHKKKYYAIRFTGKKGHVGYYSLNGHSLSRAFLRTPVRYTRVSSPFNSNRMHPILHIARPHEGVDLATPSGTPIKAAGNGKIVFRSRKGGYGKVIIIQHGRRYSTLYAHMSRFNKKIHLGSYVNMGQIIGYVGQTGLATGPHLHYEFRINNIHYNPLTVHLPNARSIPRKEKRTFLAFARKMKTLLHNTTNQ